MMRGFLFGFSAVAAAIFGGPAGLIVLAVLAIVYFAPRSCQRCPYAGSRPGSGSGNYPDYPEIGEYLRNRW
jgi:hypothetical protein